MACRMLVVAYAVPHLDLLVQRAGQRQLNHGRQAILVLVAAEAGLWGQAMYCTCAFVTYSRIATLGMELLIRWCTYLMALRSLET